MKKKLFTVLMVLMFLLSVQITDTSAKTEKVLIYAMPYDFEEYSIFTADSYATVMWQTATLEGLYARTSAADYDLAPLLADGEPTIAFTDDDNMTVTVDIKTGITFFNGDPMTADDIVYTFRLLLTPQVNPSSYAQTANFFASNDSIVAINDHTVKFTLKSAYVFYKSLISAPIMSKAIYEPRYTDDDFSYNNPNGADSNSIGPFIVKKIDTTKMEITLVKNVNYYGTEPLLDKILFKKIDTKETALSELAAGNVDIIDGQYIVGPSEVLTGYDNIVEKKVSDPSTQEVSFNHLSPYLNGHDTPAGLADPDNYLEYGKYVRKAISHLIKRDHIVSELMEGLAVPGNTLMPNVAPGWLDNTELPYRNYSVSTAMAYMEMAGYDYTTDVDLESDITSANCLFEVYILSPNTNPARNAWSILLEDELPEIGINVAQHLSTSWSVIIPLTFGSDVPSPPGAAGVNATSLGGWDIFFVGYSWDLDYNPIGMFDSAAVRPLGGNYYNFPGDIATYGGTNWDNGTSWDDLLDDYLGETDDTARTAKVELLQEFMFEWEPVATIIYPQTFWVYLDTVTGIDTLLLSISSQAWGGVDCAREVTVDEGAFGLYTVLFMFSTLFMVALYRRRR